MTYFKDIHEQTFKRVGVERLKSFMKQWIRQKLIIEILNVDSLWLFAIAAPDLITRDRFNLANIAHLHLNQLRSLLLLLLLKFLLSERPLVHSDKVIEHSICNLMHIFHSLVVDADRSREQL